LHQVLIRIKSQLAGFILPDNSFRFNRISARSAELDFGPLGVAHFANGAGQSIPNNTQTAVNFSTLDFAKYTRPPHPVTFSSNATSEIKVVGKPDDHLFLIWGHAQFASNSSGFREVSITRVFTSGGPSGDTPTVLPAVASAGSVTSIPYAVRWISRRSTDTNEPESYLRMDVKQDSGGALNLSYATINIARLY
jgi:hypothetical protein